MRSLEGNWREDVLFELQQVVECRDFCITESPPATSS